MSAPQPAIPVNRQFADLFYNRCLRIQQLESQGWSPRNARAIAKAEFPLQSIVAVGEVA